jgi:hypothetical protein
MFSVIIADKTFIEHQDKYRLFMEPFYKSNKFAFCEWNPGGTSLPEMLPELNSIVGADREWRAIVVAPSEDFDVKRKNPFDVVRHSDVALNYADSESEDSLFPIPDYAGFRANRQKSYAEAAKSALTRISSYLCGPEVFDPDSVSREPYEEQVRAALSLRETSAKAAVGDADAAVKYINELHAAMEYLEYLDENIDRNALVSEFYNENNDERHLLISKPSETYFISTRTFDSSDYDIAANSEKHDELKYSSFVHFNMYPQTVHYVVFDMHEAQHAQYEYDFVCYLEFLFTFASNDGPRGRMQAGKLYRAICENNSDLLAKFLRHYDAKLRVTEQYLRKTHDELNSEYNRKLTDREVHGKFCSDAMVQVSVDPEYRDKQSASVSDRVFGFLGDLPLSDPYRWESIAEQVERDIETYRKQPIRAVKNACAGLLSEEEPDVSNAELLTPFQLEDIAEFSDEAEQKMMMVDSRDFAAQATVYRNMENCREAVLGTLNKRVTPKAAVISACIIAVAFLAGFVPTLSRGDGVIVSYASVLLMFALSLAVVLVASVIALILYRKDLKRQIVTYEGSANAIYESYREYTQRVGQKLSRVKEVMRASRVSDLASGARTDRQLKLQIISKHLKDIAVARKEAEGIFGTFGGNGEKDDKIVAEPYEHDFSATTKYTYPLPFSESDSRKIRYMGDDLGGEIPIEFIRAIDVVREEIF